jgi:predicted transcriptional regulator
MHIEPKNWKFEHGEYRTISDRVKVDVGITKRTARNSITANTNASHWTDLRENLEQDWLGDIIVQVTWNQ